jgi:hypothetical protein
VNDLEFAAVLDALAARLRAGSSPPDNPPLPPPAAPAPGPVVPATIEGVKVDSWRLSSDQQRTSVGDLRDRILVVKVLKGSLIKIYEYDGGTALARYVWITDDPSGTPQWRRGDGGAIRPGQYFVVKPYKAGQFSNAAVSVYP